MNSVGKAIGQQLSYIFHDNKSKVKELEDCIMNLRAARDHVLQQHGTRINVHVQQWLEKVDGMINEIDEILNDKKMISCSNGLFSKHQLSKRAIKIKDDVDQLLQLEKSLEESKKSFETGNEIVDIIMNVMRDLSVRMNGVYGLSDQENRNLVRQIVSKRVDDVVRVDYQSFDSRKGTFEKIMEALKEKHWMTNVIGIYGQGGVGKTTLAREVARKAEEEKLFDKVVMISVSRNSDTKKIQSEIGDEMGMKLEEENVIGRAQILTDSLFREKQSLVILDDLWDHINLGYPEDTCKILLISRSKQLLYGYVDEEEYLFRVGVLEEAEAKRLLRKVGGVVELQDSGFESLVDKFAIKTCALSPHLILSIGSYLRGIKSYCQWKIALEMLQDINFTQLALQDMHCLDSELIRTFLHCAQLGHHPSIMGFVKYHFSLNSSSAFTVTDLLSDLKESNLLLDSGDIIMSDEVRDFALSIAHNEYNFFTMRTGKLENWPKKNELERCTAIFLHSSVIIHELPEGIHCHQLKVFYLDSNNPSLKIPDNFFRGMSELLVLELIGLQLSILPSSISCLKDLKMLSLERCMLCDNLSIIGELKDLGILNLSGSEIESLPIEWQNLRHLCWLDISNCPKLKVIPPYLLASLEWLEHFCMRNSLTQWFVEGQKNESLNASLAELSQLSSFENLEIDFPDVIALPTIAIFDKLKGYKVVIGDSNKLSLETIEILNGDKVSESLAINILNDNKISKSLVILHLNEGTGFQEKIQTLFKKVENLFLGDKLNGIGNVFRDMNLKEFSYLEHLSIVNTSDIQYIMNSEDLLEAFPKLKSLCLIKLPNLKKIIQVSECHSMEEIVGSGKQENNIKEVCS